MKIDANPTKEFFIDMITRDISMNSAILDLVDNSIDAARSSGGKLNDKNVKINFCDDYFVIEDNCGGITKEIASEYAFRFGRPTGVQTNVDNSIGRFGIGMKRALFKIGNKFSIESSYPSGSFLIEVDVNKWTTDPNWNFEISEMEESTLKEFGTKIVIEKIHQNIKNMLGLTKYQNQLMSDISKIYQGILNKGLRIYFNELEIEKEEFLLYDDERIIPEKMKINKADFDATIIAGIGEANPSKAGWYIYCNDRLVLEADKSEMTGWGGREDILGSGILYHNKYAMFRGYVYLNSDDPLKLPLTTTKHGVDQDSSTYQFVKKEMVLIMKKVKNAIDKIKEYQENSDSDEISSSFKSISVNSNIVSKNESLTLKISKPKKTKERIQYSVEKDEFKKVKSILGVNTKKDVGLKTFQYFYEMECE